MAQLSVYDVFYCSKHRFMYLKLTWGLHVFQRISCVLWPCKREVLSMVVPKSTKFMGKIIHFGTCKRMSSAAMPYSTIQELAVIFHYNLHTECSRMKLPHFVTFERNYLSYLSSTSKYFYCIF